MGFTRELLPMRLRIMNKLKTAVPALAAGLVCLTVLFLVQTTLPASAITVENIPTLDPNACTTGTGNAALAACNAGNQLRPLGELSRNLGDDE
jgi:hypothetical protein